MSNHLANLKACVPEFVPEEFGDVNNIAKQWELWSENFQFCMEFEEIKEEEHATTSRKRAAMLAIGGPKLREIFKTLNPADNSYTAAKTALDEHFAPHKNLTAERYKFLCNGPESAQESHAQWVTRLRQNVTACEFDKMDGDEAIKLVLTLHTNSPRLQKEIITKNLSLQDTLKSAQMIELAEREIKFLKEKPPPGARKSELHDINAIRSDHMRDSTRKNASATDATVAKSKCWTCGGDFPHQGSCPARSGTCNKCGKKGHYARVCNDSTGASKVTSNRRRGPKPVRQVEEEDEGDDYGMDCITLDHIQEVNKTATSEGAKHDKYPSTTARIKVNGQYILMEVDSGAEANVINEETYNRMQQKPKLKDTSVKLKPYKSRPIPVKGYFQTNVTVGRKRTAEARIYVTRGPEGKNLLGRYTAFDLDILSINLKTIGTKAPAASERHKEIETEVRHMSYAEMSQHLTPLAESARALENMPRSEALGENETMKCLQKKFSSVFTGIGKHKYRQVKLIVDETVKPVVQAVRRIPFAKRDKLEKVLQELEEGDVIEPVDGPTDWISNLVLTPKANPDEIRMNIDMTTVNKAIKRTRHVIPTVEELKYRLNGMRHFTKIDLKHGYMQYELDDGSRHLTTFYTHQGLRRAKRLMFGINAASEIFNEEIRQTLIDINNAMNIYDDIIVYGRVQQEHDLALCQVLQRLQDCGLTVNPPKCIYNRPKIEFFGLVFSDEGTAPSEEKRDALRNIAKPASAAEVRSFLGMANFSCHFIPNYSALTFPLRELTKKNATFVWSTECQTAFDGVRNALSEHSRNVYFDPSREIKLIVDGSKKDGLGSILAQKDPATQQWEVVRYDSRPVKDPERNYSQIEIESAAIEWANAKNRIYLYGLPSYTIVTDHKPLLPHYNGTRAEAPPRIIKHKMNMQGYAYTLVYEPGEVMPSDYLSRHPLRTQLKENESEGIVETELFVNAVVNANLPPAMTIAEIESATEADPEMRSLKQAIAAGKLDLEREPNLREYRHVFQELSCHEGLLVRGHQIVVPTSLREKAVSLAHEAHQGIVKSKQYLRSRMWFPRMDSRVTAAIEHCHPCQIVTHRPQREPLKMVPIPGEPWSSLRADFYGPVHGTGEHVLVVQDEYSRYPEIEILSSTGSKGAIPAFDRIMSRFGIPDVLRSDNGPPFNGHEFADFAEYMGFEHRPVVPLAPWANGLVERFMPNLTKLIQVAKEEGLNWRQEAQKYLRAYRATPHPSTGVSPAHALFNGRRYKTRLPSPATLTEVVDQARVQQHDREAKMKMKNAADRKAYVKPNDLKPGDQVLCRQEKQNKTTTAYHRRPMTVVSREGSRITASVDGQVITRHANFFKAYRAPLNAREERAGGDAEDVLPDVAIHVDAPDWNANARPMSDGDGESPAGEGDGEAEEGGEAARTGGTADAVDRDTRERNRIPPQLPPVEPPQREPAAPPQPATARPRRENRRPGHFRDYAME